MCVRPYFLLLRLRPRKPPPCRDVSPRRLRIPPLVGTQHDASANPFTFLFALMQKESDKEKNQGLRLRCYSDKAISGRS